MSEKSAPDAQRFPQVVQRAMQLVGTKIPREQLQEAAQAFRTLCWEFGDYGYRVYLLVNDAGEVASADYWSGAVDGTITMDARTLHDAAFGEANLGAAFLMGKVRVRGISALRLGKFTPLLKPFLESYRQAYEELHEAAT